MVHLVCLALVARLVSKARLVPLEGLESPDPPDNPDLPDKLDRLVCRESAVQTANLEKQDLAVRLAVPDSEGLMVALVCLESVELLAPQDWVA